MSRARSIFRRTSLIFFQRTTRRSSHGRWEAPSRRLWSRIPALASCFPPPLVRSRPATKSGWPPGFPTRPRASSMRSRATRMPRSTPTDLEKIQRSIPRLRPSSSSTIATRRSSNGPLRPCDSLYRVPSTSSASHLLTPLPPLVSSRHSTAQSVQNGNATPLVNDSEWKRCRSKPATVRTWRSLTLSLRSSESSRPERTSLAIPAVSREWPARSCRAARRLPTARGPRASR